MTEPAIRHDFPRKVREIPTLWIPMSDGARLAARVWLPEDAEDDPVPAILESIPYRRRDGTVLGDVLSHPWWAGHGYACVRLDIRGSGDSDGVLMDEYTAQEQADICEAIAWLAEQPWCSGTVGMIGISWGGFACLQVAALRPPALKAIIPCCAVDDRFADDVHYMGGCLLADGVSWGSGIFALVSRWPEPSGRGQDWRALWQERLERSGCPLIGWASHQRRDAFWQHGSVAQDYGAIAAATYVVGGWTDGYSNALLRLMTQLEAPRKALIGPWTHVYPHFGTPGPAMGFLQETLRWWDRWLKGIDNGVEKEPALALWMQQDLHAHPMEFAVGGHWIAEKAWPPRGPVETLALGEGSLGGKGADLTFHHSSPLACGMAGGEWCPRDGGGIGPEYQADQRADDALSLCFETAPLEEDLVVLGAPVVRLRLAVDRPQAMIAVRLNEVMPDGHSSRITFGLLNLSHRDSHENPRPMVPGETVEIALALNDVAYRFARGRRIRLAISTSYWPMAWPAPEPVTMTLATAGSALDLPLRGDPSADAGLPAFEAPEMSPPYPSTRLAEGESTRTLARDMASGTLTLHHIEDTGLTRIEDIGLTVGKRGTETYTITEGDPASASITMVRHAYARREGLDLRTQANLTFSCDAANFRIVADLEAFEDGVSILTRTWDETIPRDHL